MSTPDQFSEWIATATDVRKTPMERQLAASCAIAAFVQKEAALQLALKALEERPRLTLVRGGG